MVETCSVAPTRWPGAHCSVNDCPSLRAMNMRSVAASDRPLLSTGERIGLRMEWSPEPGWDPNAPNLLVYSMRIACTSMEMDRLRLLSDAVDCHYPAPFEPTIVVHNPSRYISKHRGLPIHVEPVND